MLRNWLLLVFMTGLACLCSVDAAEADKDLLVHYTFEEGDKEARPNGKVHDHSGRKNHGTLYGARYVKMREGYALAFAGGKGFAKCTGHRSVNLGTSDFTVEFWMKLDSFSPGMIMAKKGETPEARGWHMAYDNARKQISFQASDGQRQEDVSAPLADLDWHQVVVVRRRKTLTLCLDGEAAATKTRDLFGSGFSNDNVYLFLGRAIGNEFTTFHGKLDEVLIRKSALTVEEIASRYQIAEKNRPMSLLQHRLRTGGGLVLHYTFNQDHRGLAKDHSVFGHDGEIVKAQYVEELDGRRGVLRFDGEEAVLNCPKTDALSFAGDLSFEMWVRQTGTPKHTWATLFGESHDFAFYLAYWNTLVLWYSTFNDELHAYESMMVPVERAILSDRWSHIAVVVEYPRCRFYHHGDLVRDACMPFTGIPNRANVAKQIGLKMPMDLDEFRLYRRALTAAEVAAHAKGEDASVGASAELAVEPHWYEDTVTLRLTCKGADFSGHTATMTLLSGDYTEIVSAREAALTEAFPGSGRYVASVTYPLSDLAGKSVDGVAVVKTPAGKPIRTVYRHASLKKPDWVNTKQGHSDKILPPWTPVETERKPDGAVELRVWGRRHLFSASPFPGEMETQGVNILAAPIALTGRLGEQAIAWKRGPLSLQGVSETSASLEQSCSSGPLALRVATEIEYDGYMVFDCQVKANRELSLDELTLVVPLHTRHATLGYGDRVLPEDRKIPIAEWFSGAVRGDLAFRFSGNVWLGDEERGLCWQAETDEDWHYGDPQKAIEILPRGETTTFCAHFVDTPRKLAAGEALRYRFALVATPIKPILRDSWDLRLMRSEPYGADLDLPDRKTNGKPTLQYCAEAGIRRLFINVNDVWPYPMPVHKKFSLALHRLMDEAHAYGIKLHDYMIHQRYPTSTPEFDIHGLHMAKRPVHQYIPGGNPPGSERPGPVTHKYGADSQGTVFMCAKSKALQDSYIHSLTKRLDEYGDDGVYLDGTTQFVPCKNLLHGCGYRADDGSIRPTYPVFAARDFMKRIYTVVKKRRPDGVVDVHASFGQNFPALAYADVLWTGEQWWHLRKTGAKHVASALTLDKFRTEFMGRQSGVAAETLAYRLGSRMKVAATSLLHDVPVRPNNTGLDQRLKADAPGKESYTEIILKLWRVREQFGADEEACEKLFYWANQDYVRVSPERCYATLLKHPKNGVVAFVSNLQTDAQTVTVQFNREKLGLRDQKLDVFDALSNDPVAMSADGKLSLSLGSEEWVYVWLRPRATR